MQEFKTKKVSEIYNSPETMVGEYIVRLKMATRAGEINQDKLINLVIDAKGSRSMRQFADDLGVNVSTVSRIISGKVTEISDVLIARIAFHADSNSGVTIEKLMEAQGIIEIGEKKALPNRFMEDSRRIITDELLKRGYTVSYVRNGTKKRNGNSSFDFEIATDAIPNGDGKWKIKSKMMMERSRIPVGFGQTAIWLDSAMAAYYRGENAGRISLVVEHRVAFDQVKEILSKFELADEISVILISTKQGKVLDEYVAPLTDGRKSVCALTDTNDSESQKRSLFTSY